MRFKLNLAAQVGGHFSEGCDEVVADAGASAPTLFDAHALLTFALFSS
jgi:hypothetical protein